jgi:putative membrane protein
VNAHHSPKLLAWLAGAAMLAAAGSAISADKAPPAKAASMPVRGQNAGTLTAKDTEFVTKAAVGGMAEVQEGQLATEHAASGEVKKFGATMVVDHNKANDKLQMLAKQNGWSLPTELDSEAKADIDKLKTAKGAQFDSMYIEQEQKDHDKTVALFQDAAKSSDSQEIRQFAQETLPTLEHHQKMAHDMKPIPAKR